MTTLLSIMLIVVGYYIAIRKKVLGKLKKILLIIFICILVICIILFPNHVFKAAQDGVDTWFNIVFPALLPFFIGAELLIQLGVIKFIGILLEPIIRPLFNIPGEGSFVFAMSITSGYPMGAKLTSQLRNQGVFTRYEAQRLLAFCSTSGPLFMIGAVAVGMFSNLHLGIIIAISHYIGAIMTGICFRFYHIDRKKIKYERKNYLKIAFKELWISAENKKEPFGKTLGSAVKKAIETLLVIGGFIILFSVIIKLLNILGIIEDISLMVTSLGLNSNFHAISESVISGIFEMTIGCKMLAQVQNITFIQQAVLSTFLVTWSGFSIHAQAASFISDTDLSVTIYIFSKLIHAILSSISVTVVIPIFDFLSEELYIKTSATVVSNPYILSWQGKIVFSCQMLLIIIVSICLFAIVFNLITTHFK